MKKIFLTVILLMLTLSLCSCNMLDKFFDNDEECENRDDTKPRGDVRMVAVIIEMGEKISVDVIESEYTTGIHWVLTSGGTEFFDQKGNAIERSDLKPSDKVEILYSGQVMMSYPPQIVAARISVK